MRKVIVFTLVAALAIAIAAPPASALTLPQGPLTGSIFDRSNMWSDGTAPPDGTFETAEPYGAALAVGQENRTVVIVDAFNVGEIGLDLSFVPQIKQVSPAVAVPYSNGQLTGLLYDLVIDGASTLVVPPVPTAPFGSTLVFVPGDRYPDAATHTGAAWEDGSWTDTVIGAVTATSATGYGGLLVMYDDLALGADWTGGPAAWAEGTSALVPGDGSLPAGFVDFYPTFSDVVPWLVAVLAPLPSVYGYGAAATVGKKIVMAEELLFVGGLQVSRGFGFANIIGGSGAPQFILDTFGPGMDMRIEFSPFIATGPVDGWQTWSLDPIQFAIIPEPATMSLLGLSLLGLAGVRRRKKD